MATKDQIKFLENLREELDRNSEYYRSILYKNVHSFSLSSRGINTEVVKQIQADAEKSGLTGFTVSAEVKPIVNSISQEFFNTVKERVQQLYTAGSTDYIRLYKEGSRIRANDFVVTLEIIKGGAAKTSRGSVALITNTFQGVKYLYETGLTQMRTRLYNEVYKPLGINFNWDKTFDLGHKDQVALSFVKQKLKEGEVHKNIPLKPVEDLFKLIKNDYTGIIEVTVQASRPQQLKGSTIESKEKQKLKGMVRKALFALKNMPGSDSIVDIKRKELGQNLVKELTRGLKNTTVTASSDILKKVQRSKGTAVKSRKTGKVNTTVMGKATSKAKSARAVGTPNTIDLKSLFVLLQSRIQEQVAQNMQSPALVYRTGRFASSVHITDVTKTAKGFTSVGYTYDKYPYQTFEPGFAQGSVERDPRTLIDKSIRQIAIEMAMGRFYTRRV